MGTFLALSLACLGLTACVVRSFVSARQRDASTSGSRAAGVGETTEALLARLTAEIDPLLAESRLILLGQRSFGDPTCITRQLEGNRIILQASPTGGVGLRIMAHYGQSPDAPLALYRWSQETLRPLLEAERKANTPILARAEELAAVTGRLASEVRGGPERLPLGDELATSPAWPAECLRRFRTAVAVGDTASSRIWADELAAATFALADLHRWLNVLLDTHLTSLDFQARCEMAFVWTDSVFGTSQTQSKRAAAGSNPIEEVQSFLPAAGQMAAWGENYLEVEHQAEGLFGPAAAAVTIVSSQDLSAVPAARWMPPESRGAFLSLRSRLSPAIQAVWDCAAAAPFDRSYLANMLFRAASCGSLDEMGVVLGRFSQAHITATQAELMDVLFYRAGLYSSGFPWSDRFDSRILDAAGAITARRELVALRAHGLANSMLKGWQNYAGGQMTLAQALDAGQFDCVRGTDLIGALYRNAGLGEYYIVRLNCGTVGHSVGAVPIESGGQRHLLILDCLNSRTPSETWPTAYFQGLTWPAGYPGERGMLFSAELYARGLDGCLFAEGYVVRGEHAGQWVRAALPYLPGAEETRFAKVFDGPYPTGPASASTPALIPPKALPSAP